MTLITPRRISLADAFPDLARRGRPATRLHPRRGTPTVRQSHIGGMLLWPRDEPWPPCPDCVALVASLDGMDPSDLILPLIPVLQLYARDIPTLPAPEGTDVFQLLWCPAEEHERPGPVWQAVWRDSASVLAPLEAAPPLDSSTVTMDEGYIPAACVLDPERIDDLPSSWELDGHLVGRIDDWLRPHAATYDGDLGPAPGAKADGWPEWIQDPRYPTCDQGHRMDHLLTLSSGELGDASQRSWAPVHARTGTREDVDSNPAGLVISSYGNFTLFCCLTCPHRPTAAVLQHG